MMFDQDCECPARHRRIKTNSPPSQFKISLCRLYSKLKQAFFYLQPISGISPCDWIVHHYSLMLPKCHFKAAGIVFHEFIKVVLYIILQCVLVLIGYCVGIFFVGANDKTFHVTVIYSFLQQMALSLTFTFSSKYD